MPPEAAEIGEWLEAARRRHGQYSQEQAAARVGTTARTMGAWERGETVPPTDQFMALVQLYEADATELFRPRPGRDVPREDRDRMDRELAEIQAKERDSPKDSGHKPDAHRRRAGGKGR